MRAYSYGYGIPSPRRQQLFGPRSLSGLEWWVDAALGITLNGADVAAWGDQSGQGRHATQGTAADQPAYNATRFGAGRPGVDFAGATEHMVLDALGAIAGNNTNVPFTFVAHVRRLGAATNYLFSVGNSGDNNQLVYVNVETTHAFRRNLAGTSETASSGVLDTNLHVVTAWWDGVQTLTVDVDGVSTSGTPTAIGNVTFNLCGLGTLRRQTPALGANFALAEAMAFSRVLTAAERSQLRGYFAGRGRV